MTYHYSNETYTRMSYTDTVQSFLQLSSSIGCLMSLSLENSLQIKINLVNVTSLNAEES
jgi:hypothetical protein